MKKARRIRPLVAMSLPLVIASLAAADVLQTRLSPVNGHRYLLLAAPGGQGGYVGMSWLAAEAEAQVAGGPSGHLATIRNAAENAWAQLAFRPFTGSYWIGLNDQAVEGTFVWSSGESAAYRNWLPGEPNNSGPPPGEDWTVAYPYDTSGRWNDVGAADMHFGLAEVHAGGNRYDWNNAGGGVFSNAGLWLPPGPPGANDGAYFNLNSAYTVHFVGPATTALAVVERDDVGFNLAANVYSVIETYVGHSAGTSRLTLSGAGGTLLNTYATVGMAPGDHGVVVVNGANWQTGDTLWVGHAGIGYLDVSAGTVGAQTAIFGHGVGSVGDGTIRGASSALAVAGTLNVGLQGTAHLTVLNDADVTAARVYIGHHFEATGAVTVRGYGSALVSANEIVVAAEGLGTLTVEDEGFVTGTTVEVGGGWGDGHVLVRNYGSMLVASNDIVVGRGGTGAMQIDDEASVQAVNATLGAVPGSSGAIGVSGGASLTVIDRLTVGEWGDGSLTIGGGGGAATAMPVGKTELVRVGSGYGSPGAIVTVGQLNLGAGPSGVGRVSAIGVGADLIVTNGDSVVGDWGWGSLSLEAGATLANHAGWGLVGVMPGARGDVAVDGPGSAWTLGNGSLVVGDFRHRADGCQERWTGPGERRRAGRTQHTGSGCHRRAGRRLRARCIGP